MVYSKHFSFSISWTSNNPMSKVLLPSPFHGGENGSNKCKSQTVPQVHWLQSSCSSW